MSGKQIKFSHSFNPTQFDSENGLDNVYFERGEGRLPRTVLVSAHVEFIGDDNEIVLDSVTDADGNTISADLLAITDDNSMPVGAALCAHAVREMSRSAV